MNGRLRAGFEEEPTIMRNRRMKGETKVVIRYKGRLVPLVPDTIRYYPGGTLEIELRDT